MSSASSFHVIRSIPYVGGPRGCRCPMTRRHPMSASALRLAVPLHSLSYRCVSVRIHCTSRLGTAMPSLFHPPLVHSFPLPVAACPFLLNSSPSNTGPFRFISRRGPSVRIVSLSVQRPSTRCFSFPSRSFAGLTRGAVSAYMGRAVSPLWRPPPTRSGPCRCCAIGTGRAGHRSPATRARSPRPWGSSRGC